ncbi:MAG: bifunctional hydroxymethylpyrimidine kinase/phosphomethylpyrimidine kinase [Novosphingobium sp.]
MTVPPRILTIAGSDSSGGAGIQADIKTITMLGGYAMTAITAVTAQNTMGVQAVELLPPALVAAQIDSCINDIGLDAVKIGMLGSAEIAEVVVGRLAGLGVPVVFDPVMVATSGAALADTATMAAFGRLIAIATLVTPNLPELAALGGEALLCGSARAVLIKGGHGDEDTLIDRLVTSAGEQARWEGSRIDTKHNHGTGCTLAAAIASGLGQGLTLDRAIDRARQFVRDALLAAPGFGRGHGPMGHAATRV